MVIEIRNNNNKINLAEKKERTKERTCLFDQTKKKKYKGKTNAQLSRCWCSIAVCSVSTLSSIACRWNRWWSWYSRRRLL